MCINFHTGNRVIINGCSFPPFGFGGCGFSRFSPGCFGYGFCWNSGADMFKMGAGIGLGVAAGTALISGISRLFTKA